MKIIKDKKIFGIINIFDFLFILLIILLLFAAYYRFFLSEDKEVLTSNQEITYTAKIEKVKKSFIDNIKEDDLIFISTTVTNQYRKIGKITDIKIEPYKMIQANMDGTINNVEVVDYYNVILTINENGKFSNGSYYSSTNEELYINANLNVATKYAKFDMKIQEIK